MTQEKVEKIYVFNVENVQRKWAMSHLEEKKVAKFI